MVVAGAVAFVGEVDETVVQSNSLVLRSQGAGVETHVGFLEFGGQQFGESGALGGLPCGARGSCERHCNAGGRNTCDVHPGGGNLACDERIVDGSHVDNLPPQGVYVLFKDGQIVLGFDLHLLDQFGTLMTMMDGLNGLLQADGDQQPQNNGGDVDEEVFLGGGGVVGRVYIKHGGVLLRRL